MRCEIRLVRHGRSALDPPGEKITAVQFREWSNRYNETGLAADCYPTQE